MAEVGEALNTQPSTAPESKPIVVDQAPLTAPSAPRESLFKKVLNLFSPKPKAPSEPQGTQSTDQELRDRVGALQADKKNIETAMDFPDSTGTSKIADNQRLDRINQQISELSANLPPQGPAVGVNPTEQQTSRSSTDEKAA